MLAEGHRKAPCTWYVRGKTAFGFGVRADKPRTVMPLCGNRFVGDKHERGRPGAFLPFDVEFGFSGGGRKF